MRRFWKRGNLRSLFGLVFSLACVVSMLGRQLSRGDNRDYQVLRPELGAPDIIDTVLYEPTLKQLYVCYDDANQVDVYSENGGFLWAVATPYIRNTDFILREGNLILYGNGDAYIYRSADGVFVEYRPTDELELPRSQMDQCPEGIKFSSYRVWRVLENGEEQVLVSRPWWHRIFDFMVNWCICMACGAGMGILALLEKARAWKNVKDDLSFSTKRARRLHSYYRCGAWTLLVVTALEFLLAVLGVCPIFVLFPVTGCFIISGIIVDSILDRTSLSEEERSAVMFWRACHVGAAILLIVSSIGALVLWDALGQ